MDTDFTVITVVAPGVDGEKDAESFKAWYNSLDYENTVAIVRRGRRAMRAFGVRAFPSSAFIDADGNLIKLSVGAMTKPGRAGHLFAGQAQSASAAGDRRSNEHPAARNPESVKTIYVAGGCFWGVEEFMDRIPGVLDAEAAMPTATPTP